MMELIGNKKSIIKHLKISPSNSTKILSLSILLYRLTNKFRAYDDEIRKGLLDIALGDKNDKKREALFNDFLYCLQPAVRARIHIYSLDSDQTLDDTIFEAIIKGIVHSIKTQFIFSFLFQQKEGENPMMMR